MATKQRLTLYAILSAIEGDLRSVVVDNLLPNARLEELIDPNTFKTAVDRYLRDNVAVESKIPAHNLVTYLDLGDALQCINRNAKLLPQGLRSSLQGHHAQLEAAIGIRNRVMHSRPLDFDDFEKVGDLARRLVTSSSFMWAETRELLKRLRSDPSYVNGLTIPPVDEVSSKLHNLPTPDFDDTGFLGRDTEIKELTNAIRGPYPVITISGEGGVGKSALALKIGYDVIDDPSSPYDGVVWVTAKASKLTPHEIQSIDNAITSSLGLIEAAANELARQNSADPVADLVRNLENNRILLVLDNLETVIDETIRDFARRVPLGSKVILTTRVGLGAFDFPIRLNAFLPKEARHYLRRTARVWGLNEIAKFPEKKIEEYCARLQYNPLFIKWFVQGVQSGQRPESILANPKILLQYCMQNVFDHLPADARHVAHAALTVGGYLSQPTLAHLTELKHDRLQVALTELLSANIMIARRSEEVGGDDTYGIAPLAQYYIGNYQAPSAANQQVFLQRRDRLRAQRELLTSITRNVYDWSFMCVRGDGDVVPASILKRAIFALQNDALDDAETIATEAESLAPNYFEVKRVQALIAYEQRNYVKAEVCYEAALALAPNHAPLRLWYGGFRHRALMDSEGAIQQIEKAVEIDLRDPEPKLELARLYMYVRQFDNAEKQLTTITDLSTLSLKRRRIFYDLTLQLNVRKAEHCLRTNNADALKFAEHAIDGFDKLPKELVDYRTVEHMLKLKRTVAEMHNFFKGLDGKERVDRLATWLAKLESDWLADLTRLAPGRYVAATGAPHPIARHGRVRSLTDTYGFIRTDNGEDLFFHQNNVANKNDLAKFFVGAKVTFELGSNHKGICADRVQLMN